jgi:hypothetical protein
MPVQGSGIITLNAQATYPATPQVDTSTTFLPDGWHFANLSAALTVYVSFDGVNDHMVLVKGAATEAIPVVKCSYRKVWLRKDNQAGNASAIATALTDR